MLFRLPLQEHREIKRNCYCRKQSILNVSLYADNTPVPLYSWVHTLADLTPNSTKVTPKDISQKHSEHSQSASGPIAFNLFLPPPLHCHSSTSYLCVSCACLHSFFCKLISCFNLHVIIELSHVQTAQVQCCAICWVKHHPVNCVVCGWFTK